MKQYLILLSSITISTISTNIFANLNQNTTFINNLQKNNNNDNQTSLFNNQYGYLNTSDWITNQSTTDHKFYSYDTSKLKNYTFVNARKTFLVNNTGNLIYNSKITIPDKDKVNIENTKQEMINHKQITILDDNKIISTTSNYGKKYFIPNQTYWQFLQLGAIENNIDISNQDGADKVEHNNNLSEPLGLYYIARAVKNNKISSKIAYDLGKYFISKSSLNEKISTDLTKDIINIIISNNYIYNMIDKLPFDVNSQDYNLNFIFDNQNNNNLIALYYVKWNNTSNFPDQLTVTSRAMVGMSNVIDMDLNINSVILAKLFHNKISVQKFLNEIIYYDMDEKSRWFSDLQRFLISEIKNNINNYFNKSNKIGIILKLKNINSPYENDFKVKDCISPK